LAGTKVQYGLDEPGIESWYRRDFSRRTDHPQGPLSPLYNGYWVSPRR